MTIDLPPRGNAYAPNPVTLTAEQLEELLKSDDLEPATRRNLQSKLDTIRHQEARSEQMSNLTAREIVDSIPRNFR